MKNKRIRIAGLVLLQILMTAILITFLIPTIWMVSSSLKASTEVFAHPIVWIPSSPQWSNYVVIFQKHPFGLYAVNTIIITVLAVIGTVISSTMVGYSFARLKWPGKNFFFILMISTMMLPDSVTLIPRFILFRWLGWIGSFIPLIIPFWFGASAFNIFLVQQFFRGIPMELEEAAFIDGASRFQILTQVLLPLSKPVLATISIFSIIQHYNEFMTPLIYLNKKESWVLALGVRALNDTNAQNWEWVFAAATLMLIPVLLLFIFAQRYFVQGIAMTGFGGR
jgi:ABC-type glycerol-3-phosphate transport system permease component